MMIITNKLRNLYILIVQRSVNALVAGVCLFVLTQKCDAMDNSIYTTLSNQIAQNITVSE